jgi:thymidylate synthase (FAD)
MGLEQIVVALNPDVPPTGGDLGIVNAARRSFNKRSTLTDEGVLRPEDVSLLRFLARGMSARDYEAFVQAHAGQDRDDFVRAIWEWRNTPTHDTPINHGFFSFEVACPIWCRAQLVKHEYLVLSEFSRRYITDNIEFYQNDYRKAPEDRKQGSGEPHAAAAKWGHLTRDFAEEAVNLYDDMIEDGVAPEQARGILPQDLMTAFTWSGTFGAFVKMCQLRMGRDAQTETRHVAQQVYRHLERQFPIAAPLFVFGG